MELKTFITQTLTEIIDGVADAQKYALEKGAKINPEKLNLIKSNVNQSTFSDSRRENYAQMIEFDIAVSANEDMKDKGGIGVFSGAFGIGAQMENQESNSKINRIKFTVPIFLPTS